MRNGRISYKNHNNPARRQEDKKTSFEAYNSPKKFTIVWYSKRHNKQSSTTHGGFINLGQIKTRKDVIWWTTTAWTYFLSNSFFLYDCVCNCKTAENENIDQGNMPKWLHSLKPTTKIKLCLLTLISLNNLSSRFPLGLEKYQDLLLTSWTTFFSVWIRTYKYIHRWVELTVKEKYLKLQKENIAKFLTPCLLLAAPVLFN